MTPDRRPRCIVIGIGNRDRGDDAAGIAVARLLRKSIAAVMSCSPESGNRPFHLPQPAPSPPSSGEEGWDEGGAPRVVAVRRSVALFASPNAPEDPFSPRLCPGLTPPSPRPSPPEEGGEGARCGKWKGPILHVRENVHANNVLANDAKVLAADIDIIEHSGEAAGLIACMEGADQVILIDACVSGAHPGTVHRFDISAAPMPALRSAYSTHGFGLAAAVELARALGRLPPQCVVHAIEGASFEAGAPLSPPVTAAVDDVVRCVLAEIAGAAAHESGRTSSVPHVSRFPGRSP